MIIILDRELVDYEFEDIKDVIYLNIASSAIPPRCVKTAYFNFIENQIKTYGKTAITDGRRILYSAKENIAKLVNADPSEIAFVKNTAEGIGIIANGFPFKKGDNIIVCDQEFPSAILAWINLKHKGVEVRTVTFKEGSILMEDIVSRIDNNTKAVVISAVQFTTGFYIDLHNLGDVCRKNDILLIVDGIQAVGRLDIDVKKMNISYLACGGFKGLLSTFGVGFVYCDKSIVKDIIPLSASHLNTKYNYDPPQMDYDYSEIEWHEDSRRFEAGHLNYAGIASINEASKLINRLGILQIERHILELQRELISIINELPLKIMTPLKEENYSGIFSIYYPNEKDTDIKNIMDKYNIIATVNNGYIRLGINFYNTKEQIIKVADALKEISKIV
jgi:cysteine desulfurase/selenocysteine lyase